MPAPGGRHGAAGGSRSPAPGFTLIELVIVIVLIGILAGVLSLLLGGPIQAYIDTGRRADLVDVAETALVRMTRELRLALPNSIRVTAAGAQTGIEFLRVYEGGRYRAAPTTGPMPNCLPPAPGNGDPLEFACADASFDILGNLPRVAGIQAGADCGNGLGFCVVVFNTGQTGADAYNSDNLATVAGVAAAGGDDGSDRFNLTSARLSGGLPAFPLASPAQRFYVVDTPVSFVCDAATGTVTRYQGYPIAAAQSLAPGGSAALLVDKVSACAFSYSAGTQTRGALATLRLRLTEPGLNEDVTLIQQVHVQNVP